MNHETKTTFSFQLAQSITHTLAWLVLCATVARALRTCAKGMQRRALREDTRGGEVTPPGLVPRTSLDLNDGSDAITTIEGAHPSTSAAEVTPERHENLDTAAAADGFSGGDGARAGQLLVVEADADAEEAEEEERVEYSDGEGEYTIEGGDRSGTASGGGSGEDLFSAADLVYEFVEGDECRICLMDERKASALPR